MAFSKKITINRAILDPSKVKIKEFMDMDGDSTPWEVLNQRKLTKEQAEAMEGDLTLQEMEDALFNHMNGNSSPGIDGFTVNYLRVFWPSMKYVIRDSLNSIQTDGLSQTLRTAILKLLRKGDKDPLEICNYRPISLLSIFYKLASCCITRRIKPAMESIIGMQQKAYITKNNIGSCLINVLNAMSHVNKNKIPALILLIDFSKAFDSISHTYIQNVLSILGVSEGI